MIFISGATGQLGTAVINALLERGTPAAQIVAGSRKPEAAAAFATRGIQVRTADYADPASLVAAYQGIEVLYLVSGDAPIEIRSAQHRNAIAAAVKAGVKRVVYTSFVDTAEDSPFGFARIHADTERALAKSGLETTILRHGVYADILPAFVNGFAERGAIASPNAQGKAAFIARADLAAAAAVVLSAREHAGKTYTLTGPSALNMAGIAALLAARSGKPVAYQVMPAADYAAMLVQATGMPDWLAEALAGMFVAMDRGGYDNQSGDFARLLGRDALPVEAVLAEQLGL
ncbi:MAG: SDR family oxidoreductase [Rhodocyclaceae bacterium]|nr:SDR family oxidoreductase [Rhodocyclaceae bacterium]MCP5231452.1 SDR family oxidoreductase [Zoogloeaceae bacterium]MCP5239290.1 SDR family oxidoreductase [Zoogloeaceae bacterium]MCP5255877.1 SDR family oxidoreductase [Zoogloeaceae bacterium]MCW5616052.1 SDR family oxidoreductase [Rhodocyclaceae bacterium]